MKLVWDPNAWEDYLWWQVQDRMMLRRINRLIEDVMRNGNAGIGKPEPLRGNFAGYWSRRISLEHRLVYRIVDDVVEVAARGAYADDALCGTRSWHLDRLAELIFDTEGSMASAGS
mgnify:CR=1 FL=1